jgi:hypothetical protein
VLGDDAPLPGERVVAASWALAVLDDHLTALTDPPAASKPASSRASTGLR